MDLSHIMMIDDVEKHCGPVFLGTYVVLFNSNHISSTEAARIAEADEYSPYVLVLPKQQMEALFYDRVLEEDPNMEEDPK